MPIVANCPDDAILQQLLLGTLADQQFEELGSHLLSCPSCAARAGKLEVADEITLSLREANTLAPGGSDPLIDQLRGRLHQICRMQPAAANELTHTLSLPTEASVSAQARSEPAASAATSFDFLAPPQAVDEIGRLGNYRILKVLGQGGMGVVFQAEDPRLGRLCAIKAMLPEVATKPGMKERFLREARAAAQIEHDNIIPVFQVDEERGAPYIAMPFLKGMSLEEWIRKKQKAGQPTPATVTETLKIGRQIAKGLAAAHERGMIHRDIKPANVWLDASAGGRCKILDFGLARLEEAAGAQHLTQSGMIMGTPSYMAPEQAKGESLDGRADVFSLGVILYRLCTGELPFRGKDSISTLLMLATLSPTPPRERNPAVPQPLSDLVMKLLEKDPADRVPSAKEAARLLQALEKSQAGGESAAAVSTPSVPSSAPPKAATETAIIRIPPKRRMPLAIAVVGGMALLLAGIVLYWQLPGGGTVRIEINDPSIEASMKGTELHFKQGDQKEFKLTAGQHTLVVHRDGFLFETDKLVLKKGDEVALKIELLPGKIQLSRNGDGLHSWPLAGASQAPALAPAGGRALLTTDFAIALDETNQLAVSTLHVPLDKPHTVEAWITPGKSAVDNNNGCGLVRLNPIAGLRSLAGSWVFGSAEGDSAVSSSPMVANRRVHLAGVRDGTELRLFLDGKVVARTPLTATGEIKPGLFCIGAMASFGFTGVIDEVRISTVDRYPKEFKPAARFEPDDQTLALYHFDEGSGDEIADSSGNGYHGKMVGAKWVRGDGSAIDLKPEVANVATTPAQPATPNYELDLSGKSSRGFAYTSIRAERPLEAPCTVELYATPRTTDMPNRALLGGSVITLKHYGDLWRWEAKLQRKEGGRELFDFTSYRSAEKGRRFHIAGVLTKTELRLYIDGKLAEKTPLRNAPEKPNSTIIIGSIMTPPDWAAFDGTVDEVRLSSVARYTENFSPRPRFEPDEHTWGLYHCDEGDGRHLTDSSGNGHHGTIDGVKWVESNDSTTNRAPSAESSATAAEPDKPWTPRTIAEWTIQRGGKVTLGTSEVSRVEDLPAAVGRIDLVDFGAVKAFTDTDAGIVATWPHFSGLSVAGTTITDAGLRQLAILKDKGSFNVSNTSITGEGFAAFARIPLGSLALDDCRLTTEGWRQVSRVGNTTGWWLKNTNVNAAGLAEIIAMHPEIEVLSAPGTALGDASAEPIASLANLKTLFLHKTNLTDSGLQKLESVKTLTRLDVASTQVTAAGVAQLQAALSNCKIDWNGAKSPPVKAAAPQGD